MVDSNIDLSIKDVKKAQAALSTVVKETPLDLNLNLVKLMRTGKQDLKMI